jgi:predicted SAM-dependent methyltransferase
MLMKLHIGGEEPKEGWKILNIQKKPHVDFIGNISDLSQFEDQSIDEIYASHVFEHVQQSLVLQTLEGIHRVLKKGGKFYVSVPDMDILCQLFIDPSASGDVKWHVMRMMFGGQVDPHDFHYVGWNQAFMREFLKQAAFSSAERVESFGLFKDTSDFAPYGFPISLNVIAIK